MRRTIEENKKLCEEMPFLIPRNRFSGEEVEEYDYSYTELDMCEFGEGWDNLFLECLREITPLLKKANYLHEFKIMQVKEKYGELTFYTNGLPDEIFDDVQDIIKKYTLISRKTCITCGKPGKMTYAGWISPFCKECWSSNRYHKLSYEDATRHLDWSE